MFARPLSVVVATVLFASGALIAQPPPNLLVIVPDDLGVDVVGCYGGPFAPPTPNLDAIAAAGVRFTNAFVDPACSPSRAALLTGRHAFRCGATGALPDGAPGMTADAVTIARPLADAGYDTALIGKWHLGTRFGPLTPNVFGFGHFEGVLNSGVGNPYAWPKVDDGQSSLCTTYIMTDQVNSAIQWIQGRTQPWALVLTPTLPHVPYHSPPANLHTQNLAGLTPAVTPVPFFRAMVQAMDAEIGRLLATLGPSVLANTNIVVLADNGTDGMVVPAPTSNDHAKGSLYDGGSHVPLLIRGPAVTTPGAVATGLVSVVDLFPTMLALCGVAYPSPALASVALQLDGQSLLPALQGQGSFGRPFVYSEITLSPLGEGYTVRSPTHRLVRYTCNRPEHQEFFNLVADPMELGDLLLTPLNWASAIYFNDLMNKVESVRDDGWAELFGAGCAGSFGLPELRTQSKPRLGAPFYTHVRMATLPAIACMTFLGMSRTDYGGLPLPLDLAGLGMSGCALAVSPEILLLHNLDGFSPGISMPSTPGLYQSEFYVQAAVVDPGANALGVVWSRALRCVVGR